MLNYFFLGNEIVPFKFPDRLMKSFPKNGIGLQLFERKKLVSKIIDEIDDMRHYDSNSYYFRGPRASGKTTLLNLVGQKLIERGDKVYFIENAGYLQKISKNDLIKLESNLQDKKVMYLLVDECQEAQNAPLWTYLLKQENKIITIGTGIPTLDQMSANFAFKKPPSFVMLSNEDINDVTSYFESISNLPKDAVTHVLNSVFKFTTGHPYPFFAISEYILKEYTQACLEKIDLYEIFAMKKFKETKLYESIVERSFQISDSVKSAFIRIIQNNGESGDIDMLNRLGLWNVAEKFLLSDFLFQHLLTVYHPVESKDFIDLDATDAIDNVIAYGLSEMSENHFYDNTVNLGRYENAISAYIGYKWSKIVNLSITPQQVVLKGLKSAGQQPTIDYRLNGRLNKFVEVVRNGTSTSISEHLDKFINETGPYHNHVDNFVLLDIQLDSGNLQVPSKYSKTVIDKCYTYIKATNTLYRGLIPIKRNVSRRLLSPPMKASFSTLRFLAKLAK
jgi:hypothetical protein